MCLEETTPDISKRPQRVPPLGAGAVSFCRIKNHEGKGVERVGEASPGAMETERGRQVRRPSLVAAIHFQPLSADGIEGIPNSDGPHRSCI